jgi:hypothetical protein
VLKPPKTGTQNCLTAWLSRPIIIKTGYLKISTVSFTLRSVKSSNYRSKEF